MYATCFGRSTGLTGTNTPPAADVPKIADDGLEPLVEVDADAVAALRARAAASPDANAVDGVPQLGVAERVASLYVSAGASPRRSAMAATIWCSCVCIAWSSSVRPHQETQTSSL